MDSIADSSDAFRLPFRGERRIADPLRVESDEDRLLSAAILGDEEAFVALVERYQEKIFRFCCQWLSDPEDAREATQDTFVRAYLALPRYRKKARFSTWLFQIALNQCRDRFRSRSRKQDGITDSITALATEPACPTLRPDESTSRSEDEQRLHLAIQALPEKLRAVAILHGIEHLSQRQCAEILNCSERAIEGRMYRARQSLASWFRANGDL